MDISVVVPLYNEVESLSELTDWIERVMNRNDYSFEIIMIDDGSNDGSWDSIEKLAEEKSFVRGIKFRRNYGKSAALFCGFEAARGDVVITMDADLQDSPDEIDGMYRLIIEDGYDLVSGWKRKRYDSTLMKNIPSKIYNATARLFTGVKLHDMNCGLKAYRNKVVKSVEVYGDMHRYIPVLAKQAGFLKIGEKEVEHRARKFGKSKFGLIRFVNGYLDLLTVIFITKFGKSPMHFFGTIGSLVFLIGFFFSAWLGIHKIYCLSKGIPAGLVTNDPYFYISLTCMIIGAQLFLTGFLGELVSRNSGERNKYLIDKKIR